VKQYLAAAAGAALLAGLAGCSGTADAAQTKPAAAQQSPEAAAVAASGCVNGKPEDTEQLFVRALFNCDDFDLYVYNTSSARDSWLKIALEFGTVELKRGDTWLAVKA
jgi:hypothetical protein